MPTARYRIAEYRNVLTLVIVLAVGALCLADQPRVTGSLAKWDVVTIDFEGPSASSSDSEPNPFMDYRLQVEFTSPSGKSFNVPGFFDGDGKGSQAGSVWRVRFSPDEVGPWQYRALFRKGPQVAISLDPAAAEATGFDGWTGAFTVVQQSPEAAGFYRWGRLEYVGGHYLKFRDGGYWIKGGCDEPEDMLAYKGFSGTPAATHEFPNHVQDWREGDVDWDNGAGKGIIGALNYLASQHVNSIYFMPMNIGGDGNDAWPYLSNSEGRAADTLHFDLTKLSQWELMFTHAQRQGLFLHVVLNEGEEGNKRKLDNGQLGPHRKLYYREMIARFSHHLAMQWNLCEEYNISRFKLDPAVIKEYAQFFQDVDPYRHPVTVHNAGNVHKAWDAFLGDKRFQVTSFQTRDMSIIRAWREKSAAAGFPQVVHMDELWPDAADTRNVDRYRKQFIYSIYLSGGGVELILRDLLETEDYRKYEGHWRNLWVARKLIQDLPFWEMAPAEQLLSEATIFTHRKRTYGGRVFAKPGEIYVVYLPVCDGSGKLDLSAAPGSFTRQWYSPRTGEFVGEPQAVQGGGIIEIGTPPTELEQDWVVLVRKAGD